MFFLPSSGCSHQFFRGTASSAFMLFLHCSSDLLGTGPFSERELTGFSESEETKAKTKESSLMKQFIDRSS